MTSKPIEWDTAEVWETPHAVAIPRGQVMLMTVASYRDILEYVGVPADEIERRIRTLTSDDSDDSR